MASEDELLEHTIQREENRKAAAIAEIKKKLPPWWLASQGSAIFVVMKVCAWLAVLALVAVMQKGWID
jgi:hypothetical protein